MNGITPNQTQWLTAAVLTPDELTHVFKSLLRDGEAPSSETTAIIGKLAALTNLVPAAVQALSAIPETPKPADDGISVVHSIALNLHALYVSAHYDRHLENPTQAEMFKGAAWSLCNGQRIEAIRDLRQRFFLGLKEAKSLVDAAYPGSYNPPQ